MSSLIAVALPTKEMESHFKKLEQMKLTCSILEHRATSVLNRRVSAKHRINSM